MKEHIWNDVLNQKSFIYHVENNKIKEKSSKKWEGVSKLLTGTVYTFCICIYTFIEIPRFLINTFKRVYIPGFGL